MKGLFITFEGTEGSGKSTQIGLVVERLRSLGHIIRQLREPGGTPIGEEIRHTLQHSTANQNMSAETELLLINASRAQLVRETIRPALEAGEMVVCDRFYDSTVAYQGYGRRLDLKRVSTAEHTHAFATLPALQLGKHVYCEKPLTHSISEARIISQAAAKAKVATQMGTPNPRHRKLSSRGRTHPIRGYRAGSRSSCVGLTSVGLAKPRRRQGPP